MNTDETQVVAVVVRIPSDLGLSRRQVQLLESKWQADLVKAASTDAAKVKWHITIHIEIGSGD